MLQQNSIHNQFVWPNKLFFLWNFCSIKSSYWTWFFSLYRTIGIPKSNYDFGSAFVCKKKEKNFSQFLLSRNLFLLIYFLWKKSYTNGDDLFNKWTNINQKHWWSQWPNAKSFELQFPNSTCAGNVLGLVWIYDAIIDAVCKILLLPFWPDEWMLFWCLQHVFFIFRERENVQRRHIKASWWNQMQ